MPDKLFASPKPVIGMIHIAALPGTPASKLSLTEIERLAVREAKLLREAGVHGVMIENMHDTPYLRGRVGPEIVAAMAIIGRAVKETAKLPCGVQILAGANLEAMAVAHAAGLTREARNGGKSVGSGVFFACADSALWILYVMCRRQPSSLI